MHLDLHVYIHADRETRDSLARIEAALHSLEGASANMKLNLDNLTAKVNTLETVAESASTTLTTIAQEVRDLKVEIAGGADAQTAIDALADKIDAKNTEITNAITNSSDVLPGTAPATPAEG